MNVLIADDDPTMRLLLGKVLEQTQGGNIWEWRLPGTLALLIAAWIPMRDSARAAALLILCTALFLAGSMMSHAIDFGAIAIAVRFVHTLAAGAWTGALFGYWVGARSANPETHLSIPAAQVLSTLATYAPKLTRENGGIDWTVPQEQIDRKIRAMNPWPGAFTFLPTPEGPRKLKVFACIQHRRNIGAPGTVVRADKPGLLVAAGQGGVLLRDVQLEGKKRMSARDFLMGMPVAPGIILRAL